MSLEQVSNSQPASRQHSATFSDDVEANNVHNININQNRQNTVGSGDQFQSSSATTTTTIKPTAKRVAANITVNNRRDDDENMGDKKDSAFTQMKAVKPTTIVALNKTEKNISPIPNQLQRANKNTINGNSAITNDDNNDDDDDQNEEVGEGNAENFFEDEDDECGEEVDEEDDDEDEDDCDNAHQQPLHRHEGSQPHLRDADLPAWRKNLKPQYRYIPLWFVVLCWCSLVGSVLSVLYLSTQPFEEHLHANATVTKTITFGDTDIATTEVPSHPLIDSRWLYLSLPVMYLPSIMVFGYVNWLGWQFFTHN